MRMSKIRIGLIKEGKVPPDKRVPLTPSQCKELMLQYPDLEVCVQKSDVRAYADEEYAAMGISVLDDMSNCDVLMGVKEVPTDKLIPNKTYLFFSHTIKKQPYNRELLQRILEQHIQLVDYEVITDTNGKRLIGFGRYAGIVGCYNSFLAYGKKTGAYDLKAAHQCADRAEMEKELDKVALPNHFKVVLTGLGRVGKGALEIVERIGLKEVTPEAFLNETFDEPVYTQLNVTHYNARNDGAPFERRDFYNDPANFHSTFPGYAKVADVYIACHYWDSRSPFIFTRNDVKSSDWNIKVVGDISADIDGPVATTLRPSTVADPLYGYDPVTEQETDFNAEHAVGVMAIDNLPCELPKDASEDFGNELIRNVIESLVGNDDNGIISRATITRDGTLTPGFEYLADYVKGIEVE